MGGVVSDERLHRDVHPAEVLLADGTLHRDVRVFVTSRRLLAFKATPAGRVEPCLELALAEPCSVAANRGTLTGSGRLEAILADGGSVWVNRGHGCGCGSPLKALAPPVPWVGRLR